jgi:hypothetical protein
LAAKTGLQSGAHGENHEGTDKGSVVAAEDGLNNLPLDFVRNTDMGPEDGKTEKE